MSDVEFIVNLCGRLQLDGGYEPKRAHDRVIEYALNEGRNSSTQYYLTIREDALDAYQAARSSALDSDGNLPPTWRAPMELMDDAHRFEELTLKGECAFKIKKESTRRGKHLIQKNRGVTIAVGEAKPFTLTTAVALLTRYPAVLEPVDLPQPEPVKIPRKSRRKATDKE